MVLNQATEVMERDCFRMLEPRPHPQILRSLMLAQESALWKSNQGYSDAVIQNHDKKTFL